MRSSSVTIEAMYFFKPSSIKLIIGSISSLEERIVRSLEPRLSRSSFSLMNEKMIDLVLSLSISR